MDDAKSYRDNGIKPQGVVFTIVVSKSYENS